MRPSFRRLFCLSLLLFLFAACTQAEGELSTPTETSPALVSTATIPGTSTQPIIPTRKPTLTASPTRTPMPTLTPGPTMTPIVVRPFLKALLVDVHEAITGIARQEIWLLEAGETIPHPLLQSEQLSFESPRWSNNGEWIAFKQWNINAESGAQIGIIRKDGIEQHIVTQRPFPNPGVGFSWSADDRWLTVEAIIPGQGEVLYKLEIETGELTELLHTEPFEYKRMLIQPSPASGKAVMVGWKESALPEIDMWLVDLDNNQLENILVPTETWMNCFQLTTIEWSPNGEYLLVQPGNEVAQESCSPSLWLYDLPNHNWTEVARPPDSERRYRYLYLYRTIWSPDGRWVVWEDPFGETLIYNTETWQVVRQLDGGLMLFPWVRDGAGNFILTTFEIEYTEYPLNAKTILGLSPNGTSNEDIIVLKIESEKEWLLEGFTSFLLEWQP